MPRSSLDSWFAKTKDKLRIDNKTRFMLLLFFFNGLLIVILLLSVRNQEIRQRIRHVEREITVQVEELITRRASLTKVVYVTATPVQAIVRVTPTPTGHRMRT